MRIMSCILSAEKVRGGYDPNAVIRHGGSSQMEPDTIKLLCSNCDWIKLPRNKVAVMLNLEKDQYEFEATCHLCCGDIFNSRSMYR